MKGRIRKFSAVTDDGIRYLEATIRVEAPKLRHAEAKGERYPVDASCKALNGKDVELSLAVDELRVARG